MKPRLHQVTFFDGDVSQLRVQQNRNGLATHRKKHVKAMVQVIMGIFFLGIYSIPYSQETDADEENSASLGRRRFTKAGTEKGQRMLLGGPELAIQQMPKVVTAVKGGDVG